MSLNEATCVVSSKGGRKLVFGLLFFFARLSAPVGSLAQAPRRLCASVAPFRFLPGLNPGQWTQTKSPHCAGARGAAWDGRFLSAMEPTSDALLRGAREANVRFFRLFSLASERLARTAWTPVVTAFDSAIRPVPWGTLETPLGWCLRFAWVPRALIRELLLMA